MNSSWRSSVSLVEETAAVVRERVFAGRYQPGDRLAQEELSAELGLSRTPLREAYRVLAQDGLLDVDPGGTARVAAWDAGRLSEAYEFRQALGTTAVRLACTRLGKRTLNELERLAGEQGRASGRSLPPSGFRLPLPFAGGLWQQPFAAQRAASPHDGGIFRPRYGLLPEDILAVSAAHAAVVSALRAGEPDSAEFQIRSFISHELHIISQQERLLQ